MSIDWSATRQAEENNAAKQVVIRNEALIATLRKNIDTIETALDEINTITGGQGYSDDDLIIAIRSLGAYQALLKRKLYTSTHD